MTKAETAPFLRTLLPQRQRYLHFAVFVGGLTTLAAELTASRLLGNVFGTSNLVWANIIGLILLYLTAGYFIGGYWADRSPHPATFYQIMAWGAFTVGLIPIIARPILRRAAVAVAVLNAPVIAGAFVGTLLVFLVPITLLGCLSPFAIRLVMTDVAESGNISGRIYAISTLGSLLGTFLPVLVLIPTLGTHYTYLTLAGTLLLVALAGLARIDRRKALLNLWMPVVLAVLGVLTAAGPIKPIQGLLHERESAYNYIQVVQRNGTNYLLLNEGQGLHSVYNPNRVATYGTWDLFSVAPFFNNPPFTPDKVQSAAIVGLAAGTIPKQWTLTFGPIPIDGIEIDPDIVEVGREYFAMNEPNLNVIIEDGRWALANSTNTYSIIGVDAYRLPYIPWQLTTVEFFTAAREHLTTDGVLVINVGRTETDRRLVNAMASTLLRVFPSVHVMDVPQTFNTIMVATVQPTATANLRANWELLDPAAQPFLYDAVARGILALQPLEPSDIVFTDDKAPLESMTNAIVLNFILGGELQLLTGQ